MRHKEQERRMETIIRENNPIELGDEVVKCKLRIFDIMFIILVVIY